MESQSSDVYFVPAKEGNGKVTEKMSRFLSFVVPVTDADSAKAIVKQYQNKYHDARHVCWAYMLGPQRNEWQLNDNGEPSGTAGKPILGQINSAGLTNVIVLVVRYFGGIKLGTSGLIQAYREAARLAIEDAGVKEMHRMVRLTATFPYMSVNSVMKIARMDGVEIVSQEFDNSCTMVLDVREDRAAEIRSRLESVDGVSLRD